MRTTLTIDEDVLLAAKHLARHGGLSLGAVISNLARRALTPPATKEETRNGFPLLPHREGAPAVTLEMVNALRDDPFE